MKKKSSGLAIGLILLALFVLAPISLMAEGPSPVALEPVQSETIVGSIVHMDDTIPGYWTLNTSAGEVTVYLSEETTLFGRLWSFHVGDIVEVEGYFDGEGVFHAEKVQKAEDGDEEIHFSGFITEITEDYWVIAGRTVLITDSTIILGDPADVGDVADVQAIQTSEGIIGQRIIVRDTPSQIRLIGVIAEMNEDHWIVTTPIGNQTIGITDETRIEGGDPDVGDIVKISAEVSGEQITATHVIVRDIPINKRLRNVINEMHDDYWIVGRTMVFVDSSTVIEGDDPDIGDIAEVWGTVTPDGLLANRILVKDYPRMETLQGIVEAIEGDMWTISGRDVLTNDSTGFLRNPGIGDNVSVIGELLEDGTFLARFIYNLEQTPSVEMARFSGFITDIIEPVAEGDPTKWVVQSSIEVNGETVVLDVWISDVTVVNAEVEPAVGAFVKGNGHKNDDGSIDARKVSITEPPRVPFMGTITEKPADGLIGKWIIGGVAVYVTTDTQVVGDFGEGVGSARGYGALQPDGSIEALVLEPMPGNTFSTF